MQTTTLTFTSPSKQELKTLATEYGGTLERDGLLRWKLTFNLELSDDEAARLVEKVQAMGAQVEGGQR